jgi:hypothetical protein
MLLRCLQISQGRAFTVGGRERQLVCLDVDGRVAMNHVEQHRFEADGESEADEGEGDDAV